MIYQPRISSPVAGVISGCLESLASQADHFSFLPAGVPYSKYNPAMCGILFNSYSSLLPSLKPLDFVKASVQPVAPSTGTLFNYLLYYGYCVRSGEFPLNSHVMEC